MSYEAEPYEVFAADLLANLTGGVSRVRFTFLGGTLPFELDADEHVDPVTVRVHGLAGGGFRRFVPGTDFVLSDSTLVWLEDPAAPGTRRAGAVWPDEGSDFWVGYDRIPGFHPPPALTDRNPGSITRTLAESMAMEFAVLSHQLAAIHDGAFLATAEGRDLDHVVELVGVRRRGQLSASGEVTFRRATPAAADITVPAGTLVSTGAPPLVTVETVTATTVRKGTLAATAAVRAQVEGPAGVTPARTLTILHRPILGIEEVLNTQALTFGGASESDAELRSRAARALETGSRSTLGALRGALASLGPIREQDVMIEEDHLAFPGVLKLTIAADLDESTKRQAAVLIEEYRPAGIRIVHDLPLPTVTEPLVSTAEPGGGGDAPAPPGQVSDGVWFDIVLRAVVTPASTELTEQERESLAGDVIAAVRDHVADIGVGQPVIYNRVVAAVMAVEGVLDVVIDVSPTAAGPEPAGRVNLRPPSGTRPRLGDTALEVTLGGALVALDVTVEIERLGASASADPATALRSAETDIAGRLALALLALPVDGSGRRTISVAGLKGLLPDTDDYRVTELGYRAELLEEGLLVERADVTLSLTAGQQPWVRQVAATETVVTR